MFKCHFAMNATNEWKVSNKDFKYQEFFDNLLALFDSKDFVAKWFNV